MSFHDLMSDTPTIDRIGRTLAHAVWEATAIAAVLAVALSAMRRSARARYGLACAAMVATVAAAIATFAVVGRENPVAVRTVATGSFAPVESPTLRVAPPSPRASASERASVTALLVLLWAAGVTGQAAWQAVGWARVRRLGREPAVVDELWLTALSAAAERVGVRRIVRLLASVRVDVPVVLGVLRPAIVVPLSLLAELPVDHVEAILAHELAHVRRHDYLVNLIQCGVEAVFFFHPAVWWMSAVVRREREHCCDDAAATAIGSRPAVAAALVSLEERRGPRWAVAATGGSLAGRVRRLVAAGPPRRRTAAPTLLLVGGVAVLIVLGWVRNESPARAQTRPAAPAVAAANQPSTTASGVDSGAEVLRILQRERSATSDHLRELRGRGLGEANPEVRGAEQALATVDQRIKDIDAPPSTRGTTGASADATSVVTNDHADDTELRDLRRERMEAAQALDHWRDAGLGEASDNVFRGRASLERIDARIAARLAVLHAADDARRKADETRLRYAGEVYVGGDIARPGVYSITGPHHIAVSRMVIAAGDVNVEEGRQAWVTVVRREGGRQTTPVDGVPFASLLDGTAADPDLQAGDVIRVSMVDPAVKAAAAASAAAEKLWSDKYQSQVISINGKPVNERQLRAAWQREVDATRATTRP
jgi:beta-lactamase regulating signal transducer with metallopeptidase domain